MFTLTYRFKLDGIVVQSAPLAYADACRPRPMCAFDEFVPSDDLGLSVSVLLEVCIRRPPAALEAEP